MHRAPTAHPGRVRVGSARRDYNAGLECTKGARRDEPK
ncbi:hypothetical protein MYA_3345 [Burkholderia sp. KJ006]|nr:hypothetical protein MYA_3345 [Burkholderia sp. KJ006]